MDYKQLYYHEKSRKISSQLSLMNGMLDYMLKTQARDEEQPEQQETRAPKKRKRKYKSFLTRLNTLLVDVKWESDTVFRVNRETVIDHFSDLSKPAFSFKRAMKNHGFTLEQRSTRDVFVISNCHMHKKHGAVLSSLSSLLGKNN